MAPRLSALRALVALTAVGAARSALLGFYSDSACTQPLWKRDFYLGYCPWGLTLTACSEQAGWAVLLGGSNSGDCPGIDTPGWTGNVSLGVCAPGLGNFWRLETAVCEAPGNVPPPMATFYDGTQCGNSTGSADRAWWIYNWGMTISYPTTPDGCIVGGVGSNNTYVHTDPATGAVSVTFYGSGPTCTGPVYATYASIPASGACKTPTTGAALLPVGPMFLTGASANVIPSPPIATNVCPASLPTVGYVPPTTMPVMHVVGDSVRAAAGVFFQFFTDYTCSTVGAPGFPIFAGYCMGGYAVTGCNAALGWATLNLYPGNGCAGVPSASIIVGTGSMAGYNGAWAPYCTAASNWGDELFIKLLSADCSAPAAPPLMIATFSDYGCTYGDYPTGGPQPGIAVPWVTENPVWPTSCWNGYWPSPDASTWFPASISVNAGGSVNIYIYGASDATCSGPVIMSFLDVTAAAGDTERSGKCVRATSGATTDRTKPAARLRLFAAEPVAHVGPNGPSLGTGVAVSYFDDAACTQPTGGWDDQAQKTTGTQLPYYAGYCNQGTAITGGDSSAGWASWVGFMGNDCDAFPTVAVVLVKGVCTTIDWPASTPNTLSVWNTTPPSTTYYVMATSIDLGLPSSAPLSYIGFFEPTCTYEPYEWPGPLGFITISQPAAPAKCFNLCMVPDGNTCNQTRNTVDLATRTLTLQVFGDSATDPGCHGPVYSTWVSMPSKDTSGVNPSGVNTQYSGTCVGPSTGASNYHSGGIVKLRVFEAKPWLMQAPSQISSQVIGVGVKLKLFLDANCMFPAGGAAGAASVTLRGGFCNGGLAVTACNAAQSWAQVVAFSNNDCDSAPEATSVLLTTQCAPFTNGQYVTLGSADCSVPSLPPLIIVAFTDAHCTYGSGYPAGGPSASEAAPWAMAVPASPAACLPGYWPNGVGAPANSTRITVSAAGAVSIFIYGASDQSCTGPVFSSFAGLTFAQGNSLSAGTCTAATTGSFAQSRAGQMLGWARIAAAPSFSHGPSNARCAAAAPSGSGGGKASSGSATDSTTGPTAAGVTVAVLLVGAIGAAWYFRVFGSLCSGTHAKEVVHANPSRV